MRFRLPTAGALLALSPLLAGAGQEAPAPPGPVTVTLGAEVESLWPYTTDDLSTPKDPVNLVFLDADPRHVRQALVALGGNRVELGFPFDLFNCTWSDAEGYDQAAWAATEGWTGAEVQLACGSYAQRFHLRLFRQGGHTLGAAHFDVQITGTAEHEVIAWEFPEQFVLQDMNRSGALTQSPWSVAIEDTGGYFRSINPLVFAGLPAFLKQIMGLTDPRIPMDGVASVFALAVAFEPIQERRREEWTIQYNQFIPKPFCSAGPWDWLRVQGPLQFVLDVHTNPSGFYSRSSRVSGILSVTPFDTRTGALGSPMQAVIAFDRRAMLTDNHSEMREAGLQSLLGQPVQSKSWRLMAGHQDRYTLEVDCGGANP